MKHVERGEGKIGLFIILVLLAAVIFVLVKVVPARINAYEFKDWMGSYARNECWSRTEEQMKKDLLQKAGELKLPITADQISVDRRGAVVHLQATFDVPVDLKVYHMVLHYDFSQDAEHY
jgi:hypothetical protein